MPEIALAQAPSAPPPAVEIGRMTGGRFELPKEAAEAAPETAAPAETPAPVVAAPAVAEPPKPGDKPEPTEQELEQRRQSRRNERSRTNAVRQAAEQKARADLLEAQLNEARKAQAPAAQPASPGAPKIEDFNYDHEAYAKAYAEHETKNALKQIEARNQEQASRNSQAQMTQAWESSVDKAYEKYEDFAVVVGEIKPNSPWTVALMQSENGTDVAYHLGSNLKEAQRIAALPPVQQILEIGRLSAKLAVAPPVAKQPSGAPPPINPVSGTSLAESGPNEQQDMKAWIKARNKQLGR